MAVVMAREWFYDDPSDAALNSVKAALALEKALKEVGK